jgi:hypothetical protein
MSSPLRWPDAALAGFASSMRTFAGPGMLAVRGRISGRARIPVILAAVGELAMDKSPRASDRTASPAVVGRGAAAAYTGHALAAVPGAVAGAVSAAVGSFATWRMRGLVVETTGLPDPVVAVGEDVIAIGLAAVATRPDPTPGADSEGPGVRNEAGSDEDGSRASGVLRDAGAGLLAGLAGTAAMTIAQGAEFVLTGAEPSSAPADVVDRIKRRAGRGRLTRGHRRLVNQGMRWFYGASWGIPYGIVAGGSDVAPEISGPAFGLLVWGAALAPESALGLADVPWKRSPRSLGSEALFHLVYGVGAGAALRVMRAP